MNTLNTFHFEVYPEDRSSLLSLLHAIQELEGFISPEAIHRVADHTGLTDNEVYSFASFYPRFRFTPETDHHSEKVSLLPNKPLNFQHNSIALKNVSATRAEAGYPLFSDNRQARVATRNFGSVNPEEIGDYSKRGGYSGLDKALAGTPEEVEAVLIRSGLGEAEHLGLSGDQQWNRCRQSDDNEAFVIGHAASAAPVSLVEGSLLENDPHGVLEGILIAGYAAGASRGIIYVDSRRPLALSRLRNALGQMQTSGYLGPGIRGSGFTFHIQLISAAGPLPCGEVSRVITALEGRRPDCYPGLDDVRLPLLNGHPAVIHSVEILAKLPEILDKGADWYAGLGISGHKGTKMVTLSGCIRQPGLAEVPLGISLREIIDDVGGGIPEGKTFKAAQVGGPTGGWLAAEDLDAPVGYQTLAASGVRLGSGSLMIAATDACAVDLARRALLFASMQSCGHCNICREGTRQMAEILRDIIQGRSKPGDLELLEALSEGLQLGSSCSLGRSAPGAFLSTFSRFCKEYETHVKENRCPSGFCRKTDKANNIPDTERQDLK